METTKSPETVVFPGESSTGDTGLNNREIRKMRRQLSKNDYQEWRERQARLQAQEAADPVGFWTRQFEELQREYGKTENSLIKGKLKVMIDQMPEMIESARRRMEQMADIQKDMKDLAEFTISELKQKALNKGPLLRQRLGWKLSGLLGGLKNSWELAKKLCKKLFSGSWGFYLKFHFPLAAICWLVAIVVTIGFSWSFGLGLNMFFSTLLFVLILLFFLLPQLNIEKKDNFVAAFLSTVAILILMFYQAWMLFGWCFAVSKNYVGIRRQEGKVVEIVDTSKWFMRSNFRRGETLEWLNAQIGLLTYSDGTSADNWTYAEEWKRKIGDFLGSKVILKIISNKVVKRENFAKMVWEGKTPDYYREDIVRRVNALLDEWVKPGVEAGTETSRDQLLKRLSEIQNDLYQLNDIKTTIELMPAKTQSKS